MAKVTEDTGRNNVYYHLQGEGSENSGMSEENVRTIARHEIERTKHDELLNKNENNEFLHITADEKEWFANKEEKPTDISRQNLSQVLYDVRNINAGGDTIVKNFVGYNIINSPEGEDNGFLNIITATISQSTNWAHLSAFIEEAHYAGHMNLGSPEHTIYWKRLANTTELAQKQAKTLVCSSASIWGEYHIEWYADRNRYGLRLDVKDPHTGEYYDLKPDDIVQFSVRRINDQNGVEISDIGAIKDLHVFWRYKLNGNIITTHCILHAAMWREKRLTVDDIYGCNFLMQAWKNGDVTDNQLYGNIFSYTNSESIVPAPAPPTPTTEIILTARNPTFTVDGNTVIDGAIGIRSEINNGKVILSELGAQAQSLIFIVSENSKSIVFEAYNGTSTPNTYTFHEGDVVFCSWESAENLYWTVNNTKQPEVTDYSDIAVQFVLDNTKFKSYSTTKTSDDERQVQFPNDGTQYLNDRMRGQFVLVIEDITYNNPSSSVSPGWLIRQGLYYVFDTQNGFKLNIKHICGIDSLSVITATNENGLTQSGVWKSMFDGTDGSKMFEKLIGSEEVNDKLAGYLQKYSIMPGEYINECKADGIYFVSEDSLGSLPGQKPVPAGRIVLVGNMSANGQSIIIQTAFSRDGKTQVRTFENAAWGAWVDSTADLTTQLKSKLEFKSSTEENINNLWLSDGGFSFVPNAIYELHTAASEKTSSLLFVQQNGGRVRQQWFTSDGSIKSRYGTTALSIGGRLYIDWQEWQLQKLFTPIPLTHTYYRPDLNRLSRQPDFSLNVSQIVNGQMSYIGSITPNRQGVNGIGGQADFTEEQLYRLALRGLQDMSAAESETLSPGNNSMDYETVLDGLFDTPTRNMLDVIYVNDGMTGILLWEERASGDDITALYLSQIEGVYEDAAFPYYVRETGRINIFEFIEGTVFDGRVSSFSIRMCSPDNGRHIYIKFGWKRVGQNDTDDNDVNPETPTMFAQLQFDLNDAGIFDLSQWNRQASFGKFQPVLNAPTQQQLQDAGASDFFSRLAEYAHLPQRIYITPDGKYVYYFIYRYGWSSALIIVYELAVAYDFSSIKADYVEFSVFDDLNDYPVDFAVYEEGKILYMLDYASNVRGWYYGDKERLSSRTDEETTSLPVVQPNGSLLQEALKALPTKDKSIVGAFREMEHYYGKCYSLSGEIAADNDGTWEEIFVDGIPGKRLPAFIGKNAILDVEVSGNGIFKDLNYHDECASSFVLIMQAVLTPDNYGTGNENSWYQYHDGYDGWRANDQSYSEFCYEFDYISNRIRFFARSSFYNRQNNRTNQMRYDIRVRVRHGEKLTNYNFLNP